MAAANLDVADVAVVVVVVAAAAAGPDVAAGAGAVALPIARKMTRSTRGCCVEETYYMLGKQGRRTSAKPPSYAPPRSTLPTRPFGRPWPPDCGSPE